jgi:hypothetical protein
MTMHPLEELLIYISENIDKDNPRGSVVEMAVAIEEIQFAFNKVITQLNNQSKKNTPTFPRIESLNLEKPYLFYDSLANWLAENELTKQKQKLLADIDTCQTEESKEKKTRKLEVFRSNRSEERKKTISFYLSGSRGTKPNKAKSILTQNDIQIALKSGQYLGYIYECRNTTAAHMSIGDIQPHKVKEYLEHLDKFCLSILQVKEFSDLLRQKMQENPDSRLRNTAPIRLMSRFRECVRQSSDKESFYTEAWSILKESVVFSNYLSLTMPSELEPAEIKFESSLIQLGKMPVEEIDIHPMMDALNELSNKLCTMLSSRRQASSPLNRWQDGLAFNQKKEIDRAVLNLQIFFNPENKTVTIQQATLYLKQRGQHRYSPKRLKSILKDEEYPKEEIRDLEKYVNKLLYDNAERFPECQDIEPDQLLLLLEIPSSEPGPGGIFWEWAAEKLSDHQPMISSFWGVATTKQASPFSRKRRPLPHNLTLNNDFFLPCENELADLNTLWNKIKTNKESVGMAGCPNQLDVYKRTESNRPVERYGLYVPLLVLRENGVSYEPTTNKPIEFMTFLTKIFEKQNNDPNVMVVISSKEWSAELTYRGLR